MQKKALKAVGIGALTFSLSLGSLALPAAAIAGQNKTTAQQAQQTGKDKDKQTAQQIVDVLTKINNGGQRKR